MADRITVHADGWEIATETTTIGFPVPYGPKLLNQKLGPHVWGMIQWVFRLPPLKLSLDTSGVSPPDLDVLERFVRKAEELAAKPYLGFSSSLRVSFGPSGEQIDARFPNRESTTGYLVSFRQFFDPKESASYARVHTILRTAATTQNLETDVALLDRWGKVHSELRKRPPLTWVELKAHHEQNDRASEGASNLHHPRISELIETYLYGDFVHYGNGREQLKKIESEEFSAASHEMTLHEGVVGLTMFYLGVAHAIRQRLPPD